MANELVKVQFQGDTLDALKDDAGVVWVSLRRCCENLGVSTQGQLKKLKSKAWAVINEKFMTGPDGKAYAVVMLSLESVPMWLATIDARKVEGHVREKLAVYQKRCAAVLAEHFLTRKAAPEPSTDFGRVLGAAIGESMRGAFAETLKAAMLDAMRPAADRLDRVEAAMADLAVRVASPPALPPAVPVFADVNQRVVAAVKEIADRGHASSSPSHGGAGMSATPSFCAASWSNPRMRYSTGCRRLAANFRATACQGSGMPTLTRGVL